MMMNVFGVKELLLHWRKYANLMLRNVRMNVLLNVLNVSMKVLTHALLVIVE